MAKTPQDQPDPPEPADLFDWAEGTAPVPAEPIDEADLFDFTEPVTEPIDALHAAVAEAVPPPVPAPPADEEDIFAWDKTGESSPSLVGKRADTSDSSILTDALPEQSAANSGWLDSSVKLNKPASATIPPPPSPHGPNSSGLYIPDPDAPPSYDSESSIFGQNATDLSSKVQFDLDPAAKTDEATDAVEVVAADSIWDEEIAVDAERMAADREPDDAIDWEMPAGVPERQTTGRAPRPDEDDLASWLDEEAKTAARPAPTPPRIPKPSLLDTAAGLPVGPQKLFKEPTDPDLEASEDDKLRQWVDSPRNPRRPSAAIHSPEGDSGEFTTEEPKGRGKATVQAPAGEKKAKSGMAGWIGGGVAGLLIGGAGVFGLSQAGILGGDSPAAQLPTGPGPKVVDPKPPGSGPVVPQPLTGAQAIAAMDKGDAAAAKTALDAIEAPTTAEQAARGHARLMVRVQELAEKSDKIDDKDLAILDAEKDLKAVLANAAAATDEDKAAAVRAALNLGLLKELAGKTDEAAKIYADALAVAPPADKRLFETAIKRLKLRAPADNKASRLTPRQAEGLLVAVALLLQPDPAGKGDDEPGFLFIDAATAANKRDFAAAAELIGKARALHEARRLKLVGNKANPNPQSDPTHQLFSDACDSLKELYALKATIYGHPVAGKIAETDGAAKALDKLADAQKNADKAQADLVDVTKKMIVVQQNLEATKTDLKAKTDDLKEKTDALAAAEKKVETNEKVLTALVKDFKAAGLIPADDDDATAKGKLQAAAKAAAANGDTKKLADMLAAVKKELDAGQAALKTAMADLTKAQGDTVKANEKADKAAKELTDAVEKGKANEKLRADIFKALEEKKLVGADATAEKLVAAVKDLAMNDVAKLLKDVQDAKAQTDAAKAQTDAALAKLKKAEADSTAAKEDAAKAMKELDAKIAKAATDAKAQAEQAAAKELMAAKDAEAAAKKAEKAAADKLAASDTEFNRKLADEIAKCSGKIADATKELKDKVTKLEQVIEVMKRQAPGTITPPEALAQERALAAYTVGVKKHDGGSFAEAEAQFRAAIADDATDARYHYFLGLALLAQGSPAAEESFRAGGDLERRNRPNGREVGEALERVQGLARKELSKYRPQ